METRLQALRKAAGLSQSQLAAKAGVSVRLIQKYETGQRSTSTAQAIFIIKIAEALEVHPKYLID